MFTTLVFEITSWVEKVGSDDASQLQSSQVDTELELQSIKWLRVSCGLFGFLPAP